MTKSRLRLYSRALSEEEQASMHAGIDSKQLWELVKDESVHLILKRPALRELANRRDRDLAGHCETLLQSENFDEWLVGVETLSTLRTSRAVERLIILYTQTNLKERKWVTSALAKILTAEHIHPFSIMVRELAKSGQLDVTGWTMTAIVTLKHVCMRFGVEVDDSAIVKETHSEFPRFYERKPVKKRRKKKKVVQ